MKSKLIFCSFLVGAFLVSVLFMNTGVSSTLLEQKNDWGFNKSTRDYSPRPISFSDTGHILTAGQKLSVSWNSAGNTISTYHMRFYLLNSYQLGGWQWVTDFWGNENEQTNYGYLIKLDNWATTVTCLINSTDTYYVIFVAVGDYNPISGYGVWVHVSSYAAYVFSPPSVSITPGSVAMDLGQSHLFTSTVSGGTSPYSYQWYLATTISSNTIVNPGFETGDLVGWNQEGINNPSIRSDEHHSGSYSCASPYMLFEYQPFKITQKLPSILSNFVTKVSCWYKYGQDGASVDFLRVNYTDGSVSSICLGPLTGVWTQVTLNLVSDKIVDSLILERTTSDPNIICIDDVEFSTNCAPVAGATGSTWTFAPGSSGSYEVYVQVTDNVGFIANSNIANVTVNPPPSVAISPSSVVMDVGQSQLFTSTVSQGTLPYSYQWYLNGAQINGANSSNWVFTPPTEGSYLQIYVKVTDNVGVQAISNTATVTTVNSRLTVSVSPSSVVMDVGQSQMFTSSVSGGTSPYFYQWYLDSNPVLGATSSTWTFTPASTGVHTVYVVLVDSATNPASAQSNNAPVTVLSADSMWVDPESTVFNSTVPVGQKFNVTVWMNITENVYSYQIGLLYNRTQLKCTRAGYTAGATSQFFAGHTTTAVAPWIDGSLLGNGSVLGFETLSGTDQITGPHSGSLMWIEFQILIVPPPVSGNLTSRFDISSTYANGNTFVLDPNYYSIAVTPYDGNYLLISFPSQFPFILPSSVVMDVGQSQLFTSNVSGSAPPYTYQWYLNATPVSGAIGSTWTFTPTSTGSCTVYVNVTDGVGAQATSNIAPVTVNGALFVTISPTSVQLNLGQHMLFNSSVVGGTLPYTYQWYLDGALVSGATGPTWVFTPASAGSYTISLIVADSATHPASAQSNNASVTVLSVPPRNSYDADSMWVDPTSTVFNNTVSVGQTFNVTVWMNITQNVFVYQIGLHYNRTQLKCTRAGFTAGATSIYFIGHATTTGGPIIDGSYLGNGSIVAFECCSGNDFISGPRCASLIWAEFQILQAPSEGQILNSTFDISTEYPSITWVEDPNLNNINLAPYDGNYLFIGVPLPFVSINPSSLVVMDVGQSQLFISSVSDGTSPYMYQWYLNDVAVLGATSATWTFTPGSSDSYGVYVNVTDSVGFSSKSNVTSLIVNPVLTADISPTSATFHLGQSQLFMSNVTGGTSPYSYQWYSDSVLVPGASGATWTFIPSSTGSYLIYVEVFDSVGFEAASNNATITVWGVHDVAVVNVTSNKTVVFRGYCMNVSVTVGNLGDYVETLNLTAYANTNNIASQNITLTAGSSTTVTFTWNTTGFAKGTYTISAYAWPVPGESNTANNNFKDGWIFVSMVGDLTGGTSNVWDFVPDGKCDGKDISTVAKCFGSYPGCSPPLIWNANCDVTNDGKVDGQDIAIVARHFGEYDP